MVTLGDVWAVTAIFVGVAACAWALLLCLALLFPARTETARDLVATRTKRTLIVGVVWTVVLAGLGIVMLSAPLAPVKLVGWVLLLALMAVSFVGSAGIASLASERLKSTDATMNAYGSLSRGALLMVLPCILPILGWFLFAPAIFCLGAGAGFGAIRAKSGSGAVPMGA